MTELQKRILWAVAAFAFFFNASCLGFCLWHDHQTSKAGIDIAAILSENNR